MKATETITSTNPLAGKLFHEYKDGKIRWQGQVLGYLGDGQYLFQLFEWLHGLPTDQVTVPATELYRFCFYDTEEQLEAAYEKHKSGKKHPQL